MTSIEDCAGSSRGAFVVRSDASRGAAPASAFWRRLSCLQPGCTTDYASSDPAFPGDFQTRHQIALASAPTRMDVYPVGGSARRAHGREPALLRPTIPRVRLGRSRDPDPRPRGLGCADAVSEIRAVLRNSGLRARIRRGSYVPYESEGAAPIRWPSWGSRRRSGRPADCGRRTSLPDRPSKGGRTSHTTISDARPSPWSPLRSTTRAISSRPEALGSSDVANAHPRHRGCPQGSGPGHVMVDRTHADRRERSNDRAGVREDAATHAPHRIEPIPRVSIHAFCETAEIAAVIEAAAADRRLAKAHVRHAMGGRAGRDRGLSECADAERHRAGSPA